MVLFPPGGAAGMKEALRAIVVFVAFTLIDQAIG